MAFYKNKQKSESRKKNLHIYEQLDFYKGTQTIQKG